MDISHLHIGILHSLIGKNDGVSIVIDQTVNAMVNDLDIGLGNIFFLAAHSSPRFNAMTDDIFWHKSDAHRTILNNYSKEPPFGLDELIHNQAIYAKKVIKKFVDEKQVDLLIAHNISHPYNFITAVGLGYYIEELREQNLVWPKVMVWWHDSYFEREIFRKPNPVIEKYLKFLPGTYIDGCVFINHSQQETARGVFKKYNSGNTDRFFKDRTCVIPNTSEITWDWKNRDWESESVIYPEQDNYNESFFFDVGLEDEVERRGFELEDTVILLQHTRVVPRKKIETAIDFAFKLEDKFIRESKRKCIALLVSGHSGDEQFEYKKFLNEYFDEKSREKSGSNVILIFGEDIILSHRDIIVDKKYYKFAEIPSIVAARQGIGTFFSEVEGYGNNLLEMISFGLPVMVNRYPIFKEEIEPLDFDLAVVDDCDITGEVIDSAYELLVNTRKRNSVVQHNLKVLDEKLSNKLIAEKLEPLIVNMFTKVL